MQYERSHQRDAISATLNRRVLNSHLNSTSSMPEWCKVAGKLFQSRGS